ncbi:MAG: hypothetical protein ABR588_01310 [Sphingomicrobium sp.]|nr:hypothetical protein [Sphingomonadales bacterium]
MAKGESKKAKKAESKPKGEKKKKAKIKIDASNGFDTLAKLADHPLVTDLLAVGAMAAVAAIAEQGVASKTGQQAAEGSRKAVKAAGKAAAAAIGQRLLKEVGGLGAKVAKKA